MENAGPLLSELIAALQIFLEYGDVEWPTNCEHDEMWMTNIDADAITAGDRARLEKLGFEWDECDESYKSYAFGSA